MAASTDTLDKYRQIGYMAQHPPDLTYKGSAVYRVGVVGRDAVSSRSYAPRCPIEDPDRPLGSGPVVPPTEYLGLGAALPEVP